MKPFKNPIKKEKIQELSLPPINYIWSAGLDRTRCGKPPDALRAHFYHHLRNPDGPDTIANAYMYECIHCHWTTMEFKEIQTLRNHARVCKTFDVEEKAKAIRYFQERNEAARKGRAMYKSSKQQDIGHPNEIISTLTLPTDPTPATTTNPSSSTTINDYRTMDDNSRVNNIDINDNSRVNSNDMNNNNIDMNNNNNNKSMTTSHSISGDTNTSQLTFNDCIISTSGPRDNFEDGAGGCSYDKVRGHCAHFNQLPNLRHSPFHSKYSTFKHPTSNMSATTIPTPSNLSPTQQQIVYHHVRAAKLKELQFLCDRYLARFVYLNHIPFNMAKKEHFLMFLQTYFEYKQLAEKDPYIADRRFLAGAQLQRELFHIRSIIASLARGIKIAQFCVDETTKQRITRLWTVRVLNGIPFVFKLRKLSLGQRTAAKLHEVHGYDIEPYLESGGTYGLVVTDNCSKMVLFRNLCVNQWGCIAVGCIGHCGAGAGGKLSNCRKIDIDSWTEVFEGMNRINNTIFGTECLIVFKREHGISYKSQLGSANSSNSLKFISSKLKMQYFMQKKGKIIKTVCNSKTVGWFDDDDHTMIRSDDWWRTMDKISMYYSPYEYTINVASRMKCFLSDYVYLGNVVSSFYVTDLLFCHNVANIIHDLDGDRNGGGLWDERILEDIMDKYEVVWNDNVSMEKNINFVLKSISESGNYIGPEIKNNYLKKSIIDIDNIEDDLNDNDMNIDSDSNEEVTVLLSDEEKMEMQFDKKEEKMEMQFDEKEEEKMEMQFDTNCQELIEGFKQFAEGYHDDIVVLDHSTVIVINHSDPTQITINNNQRSHKMDIEDHLNVARLSYYDTFYKNYMRGYHEASAAVILWDCRRVGFVISQDQYRDGIGYHRRILGDQFVNDYVFDLLSLFRSRLGIFSSKLFDKTVADPTRGWKSLMFCEIPHVRRLSNFVVSRLSFKPSNMNLEQHIKQYVFLINEMRLHLSPERIDDLIEYKINVSLLNKHGLLNKNQ